MPYLGDFRLGVTLDFKFTTVTTTGAPTTLAGTPVVSIYADNGTTEITAGITLTVDFDSRNGFNNVRVVATSGNGYAAGVNYAVVITTGTVGGVSVVGYVVAHFSIENRSALMPTAVGRTLDVSTGGEGGVDWANVGSPTTAQNLSGTNIDVDQVVASVSGAVGSVTGAVGSVAAGGITAASIATGAVDADALAADAVTEIQTSILSDATPFAGASIAAIKAKTDNLPSDPADQSLIIAATNAITAAIAALNNLSAAQVNAEVVDVLATDTYAEPGQAMPAATTTLALKIGYLFKAWRNRSTQTASEYNLYNDDATTVGQKASFSDDAVTADRGEVATGP